MNPNRSLLFHGSLVLVLSLLAGVLVATPGVANPRMAVAAHLAALISGPILLSLGLAWPYVELPARVAARTSALLVVSLYLNVAFVTLAALFGTSQATPLAGAGHSGTPWQEAFVSAGFALAIVGMFVAFVLVAVGFSRGRAGSEHT